MRVTRLEIFGFKSFMDRLVLPLDGGITGVVGPNGCGKSNIVDALRWVLGETNAKNLRGDLLEDVIFSGTDALRPLGLAEVTLTLQASGDTFFSDLTSSDAEAELISELAQAEAEMKAAEDLAQETAEGTNGDSGAETEVTESREEAEDEFAEEPRPRLTVIDGNKDKPEKTKEVEKTLLPTPKQTTLSNSLLHRFTWLKSAQEVQVTRRLYRSGESEFFINRVSCRLKDVKEFFRAVGISARAYTIVAQGQVSRIVSAKPTERRLIIEEAAGVLGFRDKISASERRLDDTMLNISRIDDIYTEISRQVRSLSRQATKAKNRESLKSEIATLEKQIYADMLSNLNGELADAKLDLEKVQGEEQEIDDRFQGLRAKEEQARSQLMTIDVEGDDIRAKIDALREEMNNRAKRKSEKTSRLEELKAFTVAAEQELAQLSERKNVLAGRRSEVREKVSAQESQERELVSRIDTLREILRGKTESLQTLLKEKQATLKTKEEELAKITEALNQGQSASRDQLLTYAGEVTQIVHILVKQIELLERHFSEVDGERESEELELQNLSNQLGHTRGAHQALRHSLKELDNDLSEIAVREDHVRAKAAGYNRDHQQISQELASLETEDDSQLQQELEVLKEKYNALDEVRSQNRSELGECAERVDEIRQQLDTARAGLSDGQLALQKIELELEHVRERVVEDYGESLLLELLALRPDPLSEEALEGLQEQVTKLKARLAREGEVDPTAVARFEEEKQRLEDLDLQRKDLESAAATLKKTIEKLRLTSQERFQNTFEAVRKNFQTLIPRLFGGGVGELELTDDKNPLDAGVLINVRPPGKKLKSIDLLSGGEKALCATALIISMFLVRPSPLCVLDEVDAPLDEANLVRFLSVIKEMSRKTQFLMITHNKGSMSSADRLVGVTMQQPGASKVITVSLQEAYSQVA